MEPTTQLRTILPAVCDLVDQLEPTDLERETPCREFDLADVIDHMMTLGGSFAYLFLGERPPVNSAGAPGDRVPSAEFRRVMDDLFEAVQSPGALERTIDAPVGSMPGEAFARLVAFDGLVHGWDIARSAGLEYRLPDDVVAAVDEFARGAVTPAMRDGDTFADPTPPPPWATPVDRVAAFSGRMV